MARQYMLAVGAAVALLIAAVASQSDPCSVYPTCQTCVSHPLCGWCSESVVYPNGTSGAQCAGFNPNQPDPFQCNGIFSTEQCFAGYVCDEATFQCKLGQPGQGTTLQKCEANCTNNGQVYLCNHTSETCYQVPRGTPGAASEAVCQQSCSHPSPHPAPPTSPKPQSLFACNTTSGQCVEAPAGKGEAKSVCEQQCQKILPDRYMCNTAFHKCQKMPPDVPGGESLQQCEQQCNPSPKPHPPPQLLNAFFRGIQIQKGYVVGSFSLQINNSIVAFAESQGNKLVSSWTGTPGHYESSNIEMTITLTSGPNKGQVINTLTVFGSPTPETKQAFMAMSAPGGAMPTSIPQSISQGNGVTVYAFSECQTPECVFTLPPGVLNRVKKVKAHRQMHRLEAEPTDSCSQWAANCSYCLAHPFCGWCSEDVQYQDGTKGTQCAGFNNANGTGPAWKCNGRYSTFNCTQGYECDHTSLQCKPTTPGNGMPLDTCKQFCHATPPPTSPSPMALCNLTTKQCHPCPDNATHCPGSLPLGACEAECSHHKKGPHAAIKGVWRGIYIQNGYLRLEVDMVVDNETITFVQAGEPPMKCNVTTLGSDLMIFDILTGQYKGWTFSAMFQTSDQTGGFITTMTMAAGKLGGSAPQSFSGAMSTQGDRVYVLEKCNGSPCSFANPVNSN